MIGTAKRLTYLSFGRYDHVDFDAGELSFSQAVAVRCCPCCRSPLRSFTHAESKSRMLHLLLCPCCGWWHLHREDELRLLETNQIVRADWWERYHAVYSEIVLNSPDLPIEQLRFHLARFWEQRKHVSAQQAEDLVGAVLREHYDGEIIRLTANANAPDGGIDLFICSKDGSIQRAVQVKRRISQDIESVKEVRNFIGAMLLTGSNCGVFVSTAARFTSDATAVATNGNLSRHQLSLELIDGERLLELLEETNRKKTLQLPPDVRLEQIWQADHGAVFDSYALLFGDLNKVI